MTRTREIRGRLAILAVERLSIEKGGSGGDDLHAVPNPVDNSLPDPGKLHIIRGQRAEIELVCNGTDCRERGLQHQLGVLLR